jgi:hypothetical protein
MHACVMCVHYAPGRHYDCAEPEVELVTNKVANNRCDWFRFRTGSGGPPSLSREGAEALLKDLFRKS